MIDEIFVKYPIASHSERQSENDLSLNHVIFLSKIYLCLLRESNFIFIFVMHEKVSLKDQSSLISR